MTRASVISCAPDSSRTVLQMRVAVEKPERRPIDMAPSWDFTR